MQLPDKSPCPKCKNLDSNGYKPFCKAFKGEIPNEILSGKNDHTKPFKGDNGIRFEPIKEIKDA